MIAPFSIIGGQTAARCLSDCRRNKELVRRAYLLHGEGRTVDPASAFLRFPEMPDSRIIAKPAYLGGEFEVAGMKWISSFPGNRKKGLPRASAVLILNDCQTGYPLACLESSIISASRTAASAVLAAEALRPGATNCRTMGFIGAGLIAKYIYRHFIGNGWKIEQVLLYDLEAEAAKRFALGLAPERHAGIKVCDSAAQLMEQSSIIVVATDAREPHLFDHKLLEHAPLVLHISLRDLSSAIILGASNFTDDIDHAVSENTSLHLAEKAAGHRRFIQGTLYDLLIGKIAPETGRPMVFSPFGLGILDLALGKYVYDQAVALGEAQVSQDFYG